MKTFSRFLGAGLRVIALPFTLAADVVTMGGVLVDKDRSFTGSAIRLIGKDIDRGIRELED